MPALRRPRCLYCPISRLEPDGDHQAEPLDQDDPSRLVTGWSCCDMCQNVEDEEGSLRFNTILEDIPRKKEKGKHKVCVRRSTINLLLGEKQQPLIWSGDVPAIIRMRARTPPAVHQRRQVPEPERKDSIGIEYSLSEDDGPSNSLASLAAAIWL
ncbi:tetratricopeptide repeat protein [Striga asiatica]|uniref:Tetratricopeptide repeat protein n=1 Tax=Striga asiatica TaxID=4170 RepID=A0A5A7P6B9_STRAF|nr:tetratricopeptide repeat protein [Striga asiatica]